MKTHATFRYLLTVASLAAVLAVQPPNSRAHGTTAAEEAQAKEDMEQYDFVISNGRLLQEHDKATVKTVVNWLRKQYGSANIVYAPELAEEPIPDVKLRGHDLPEVLEAIRVASGGKFDWMGPGSPGLNQPPPQVYSIDHNTGLPATVAKPDPNSGLYVLRVPLRNGENERVVEAFNIAHYLDLKTSELPWRLAADENKKISEISPDEISRMERATVDESVRQLQLLIVDTIASYLQTQDEEQIRHSLKFQFHQGANLLIITGPREQVEVVRKVMGALTADPAGVGVSMPGGPAMIPNARENAAGAEEPVSIEAIPVKSADLTTAYSAAMSLLNNKRSKVVVMDDRTKTLIVSATKAEVKDIKEAIKQLDLAAHPLKEDLLDVPEKAR